MKKTVTHPGNVLIVVENNWVPVDRRVWYEATTLRDFGWKVTVICPAPTGAHAGENAPEHNSIVERENIDGVIVYRFHLTFAEEGISKYLREYISSFIWVAKLSWKIWREERFDILHICNPPDIFFPIGLFYRILGAKLVFDHHDLFPEMVIWRFKGVKGKLLRFLGRLMEYLTFKSSNVVLTTNESYKQIALNRNRIRKDSIYVVRNGPKIREFKPVDPDLSLRRHFPYVACYVGIMGEDDGVSELVDVIRLIVQDLKRTNILFILVGDGSDLPLVKQRVADYGLDEFVDMPGMIRDDLLLRRYMCSADVLLSPEPWTPLNAHSTFIKVGEYMAMGKPIVAYDFKETKYTAEDAAVYVSHGDVKGYAQAILSLLENENKRKRMGKIGFKRVKELVGWENQKRILLDTYRSVLLNW